MEKVLYTVEEVAGMIKNGDRLILSGMEDLISQLPAGDWIAGTTGTFMAENGGTEVYDKIFVTKVPSYVKAAKRIVYSSATLSNVYTDAYAHGYTIIIIPYNTEINKYFSMNGPSFPAFATRPLAGWVACPALHGFGKKRGIVYNGTAEGIFEDAVAFHFELPENKVAEVTAISPFVQGNGPVITVEETLPILTEAYIDGEKRGLAAFLREHGNNGQLPLVADYSGTSINSSVMLFPDDIVFFTAPLVKGIEYRIAEPVDDYAKAFEAVIPQDSAGDVVFSCNCVLNYMYGNLAGKRTGSIMGPCTAGEICYQLVNQTMVCVEVFDI